MRSEPMLRVGDEVIWRGSWGSAPPARATVRRIDRTAERRSKDGVSVREVPWSVVRANFAIVDLDNGSWAYGEQLEPVPAAAKRGDCTFSHKDVRAVVVDGFASYRCFDCGVVLR